MDAISAQILKREDWVYEKKKKMKKKKRRGNSGQKE